MPNLTPSQIQQIFNFTAQKYIKYYDVQLELVDHIANRIEEMQTEDPKLSFDSALQKVYKSFGIYGFTKVQEQKVRQMERFWAKKFWSYYKSYFRLPKILLIMGLSILFYFYLDLLSLFMASSLGWYFTVLTIFIVSTRMSRQERKRNSNQINSKYLVVHSYAATIQGLLGGGAIIYPSIGNFLMTDGSYGHLPLWAMIMGSILLSFIIINHHALYYVFPHWLHKEINIKYGHLELTEENLALY